VWGEQDACECGVRVGAWVVWYAYFCVAWQQLSPCVFHNTFALQWFEIGINVKDLFSSLLFSSLLFYPLFSLFFPPFCPPSISSQNIKDPLASFRTSTGQGAMGQIHLVIFVLCVEIYLSNCKAMGWILYTIFVSSSLPLLFSSSSYSPLDPLSRLSLLSHSLRYHGMYKLYRPHHLTFADLQTGPYSM
jgi:hypothetical protein